MRPPATADLQDFVRSHSACRSDARQETKRFRRCRVHNLLARDKLNLDNFWLKEVSLDDVESLPMPDLLAAEIVENLQAALRPFRRGGRRAGAQPRCRLWCHHPPWPAARASHQRVVIACTNRRNTCPAPSATRAEKLAGSTSR